MAQLKEELAVTKQSASSASETSESLSIASRQLESITKERDALQKQLEEATLEATQVRRLADESREAELKEVVSRADAELQEVRAAGEAAVATERAKVLELTVSVSP